MNGLPYYKAYPRDFFDGTVGMDFEVKAAYRLLLDLIYMHGGRLADDPRFIAGHLGCSVKKWNALRATIIAAGKITTSGGYLGNFRADKELDSLKSFQGKQRENRLGSRKNNDLAITTVKPKSDHTESDTDTDKVGGDGSAHAREAFATDLPPLGQARQAQIDGDEAAAPQALTFRERILTAMGVDRSGMTGRGGTRIGTSADMLEVRRWVSDLGLTPAEILDVIAETMAAKPDGPPSTFGYFGKPMRRYAAAKARAAEKLTPDDAASAHPAHHTTPSAPDLAAIMARREAELAAQERGDHANTQ